MAHNPTMASSEAHIPDLDAHPGQESLVKAPNTSLVNGVDVLKNSTNGPTDVIKAKSNAQPKENNILKGQATEGKPSGAESKKKKKEEKAANRALKKQDRQSQPANNASEGNRVEVAIKALKKGSATSEQEAVAIKQAHKSTGPISASSQRSLPLRSTESPLVASESKKENKNVALFGHLYGNPRRTTIAGATKDVHPAVLALGLQMSNYIICGSNARCVATLLVFKQVRMKDLAFAWENTNRMPGY